MPEITNNKDLPVFQDGDNIVGKKIVTKEVPQKDIGIDTDGSFFQNIAYAAINSHLDTSELNSFTNLAEGRDGIFKLIDQMGNDSKIAAVLESYATDCTETDDQGRVVWCEASDSNIQKYITFLLDSMRVDKNAYSWVYSLIKYGDVYLRLYRESEYDDILFREVNKGKQSLNEDLIIKAYRKDDPFVHYVEMVPNPAEVFDLTKFGKTIGYIKADVSQQYLDTNGGFTNPYYKYQFKKQDVELYSAVDFVHGSLQWGQTRHPEEVNIFLSEDHDINAVSSSYTVKSGQSILYNLFKVWRELDLLKNSVLLNRITQSSVFRLVEIETGDVPKTTVPQVLQRFKQLFEQKTALNTSVQMNEYTNPGPIINTVYLPKHGEVGQVNVQTFGGDPDPKSLVDLEYFDDEVFAGLRVPKQFFARTGDSAGFDGGESLAIISSQYAKAVKHIQNIFIQTMTDLLNILLIDKGEEDMIGKFKLRMQEPTTKEEVARRENLSSEISIVSDTMNLVADIDDPVIKLKMLKSLLSNAISNTEVIDLIQQQVDKLEQQEEDNATAEMSGEETATEEGGEETISDSTPLDLGGEETSTETPTETTETPTETSTETTSTEETSSEETLPTPGELGVGDMSVIQ